MQLLTFTLGGVDFAVPLKDIEFVEGRINRIEELPSALGLKLIWSMRS